jgi:DUF1365 family protein
MTAPAIYSAIYTGPVTHIRWKPLRHTLRYSALYLLLDLDELPQLDRDLRLFSTRRSNLFGFRARDHGAGTDQPLRTQVEAHLRTADIDLAGGPIRLLCMPRVLGTVFNPISVYFCHHADGRLAAMLYEVNNTFGERHSYLIPVADPADIIRQSCAKRLYVSPFLDMALTYRFRLTIPDARAALVVSAHDSEGAMLTASFVGERHELTDAHLWRIFLRYPLLAMQVLGAIHWEALKLWRKGLGLKPRPAAPINPITIATPEPS